MRLATKEAAGKYPGGLKPPTWVPWSMRELWRYAVERVIETEGGDAEDAESARAALGPNPYEKVVPYYRFVLKKYDQTGAPMSISPGSDPSRPAAKTPPPGPSQVNIDELDDSIRKVESALDSVDDDYFARPEKRTDQLPSASGWQLADKVKVKGDNGDIYSVQTVYPYFEDLMRKTYSRQGLAKAKTKYQPATPGIYYDNDFGNFYTIPDGPSGEDYRYGLTWYIEAQHANVSKLEKDTSGVYTLPGELEGDFEKVKSGVSMHVIDAIRTKLAAGMYDAQSDEAFKATRQADQTDDENDHREAATAHAFAAQDAEDAGLSDKVKYHKTMVDNHNSAYRFGTEKAALAKFGIQIYTVTLRSKTGEFDIEEVMDAVFGETNWDVSDPDPTGLTFKVLSSNPPVGKHPAVVSIMQGNKQLAARDPFNIDLEGPPPASHATHQVGDRVHMMDDPEWRGTIIEAYPDDEYNVDWDESTQMLNNPSAWGGSFLQKIDVS